MLPAAVALGGQAALGLVSEAGRAIASAVDPAAIAYRQQMRKDVKALKQGQLGLSEAEKRTMLAGTQRALQAQTSAAEANLRRSAAAMGGFGRSGAQQAALGQMGAAQQEKIAESMGRIDEQSQRVAEQRFESIMGRLAAKRKEAMDTGTRIAGGVGGYGVDVGAEAMRQRTQKLADTAAAELARQQLEKSQAAQPATGTLVR
jgi:hypothetical protein